jgi:hypothetical protein
MSVALTDPDSTDTDGGDTQSTDTDGGECSPNSTDIEGGGSSPYFSTDTDGDGDHSTDTDGGEHSTDACTEGGGRGAPDSPLSEENSKCSTKTYKYHRQLTGTEYPATRAITFGAMTIKRKTTSVVVKAGDNMLYRKSKRRDDVEPVITVEFYREMNGKRQARAMIQKKEEVHVHIFFLLFSFHWHFTVAAKCVCGFQDGGFMIANMELLSQPERNSQSRENIKDISSSTLCSERRLVRLSLFVCS